MPERIETHVLRGEGVTLSRLIWRIRRKASPGLVERAFDLNPGLADAGNELPVGRAVRVGLPDGAAADAPPRVDLWT